MVLREFDEVAAGGMLQRDAPPQQKLDVRRPVLVRLQLHVGVLSSSQHVSAVHLFLADTHTLLLTHKNPSHNRGEKNMGEEIRFKGIAQKKENEHWTPQFDL